MSGINLGPITVVSQLSAAPSSPVGGQLYYDTDDGNLYVYDAIAAGWVDCTAAAGGGVSASSPNTWTALQTFRDTTFEITDDGDTTKKVNFQLSGVATGTTRTLTVPNANGTLALTADLPKVFLLPYTWAVGAAITTTLNIPEFFIPLGTGQTARVVGAKTKLGTGTSATMEVRKNGTAQQLDGAATDETVTTTATAIAPTTPWSIANGDALDLVCTAISGTPADLSFTLYVEYTI